MPTPGLICIVRDKIILADKIFSVTFVSSYVNTRSMECTNVEFKANNGADNNEE